jgi:uncharacterized membrane protein
MREPITRTTYFALSLSVGAAAGLAAFFFGRDFTLDAAALGLFLTYLAIAAWNMPLLTPDYLRRNARQEDLPVTFMFGVVLLVVAVAVYSLFQLINEKGQPDPVQLCLALASVAAAWLTIHTMYALHYAHLCWLDDDVTDAREDDTPRETVQGLEFPGDDQPGGLDFLYFSFVIGMTAQTADVDTTTQQLRRVVLVHSIFAYLFNTVIVAAAVNLAVSLGD